MYVIVVYDADPKEQKKLRRVLFQQLNRIQNSVFAGHLRNLEVSTLLGTLEDIVDGARVQVWVIPAEPAIHQIGAQWDEEDRFL